MSTSKSPSRLLFYSICLVVGIFSLLAIHLLQQNPSKTTVWFPLTTLAGSSVVALFGIIADLVRHERNLMLSDKRELFELSASGYMAQEVFERFCSFAENYTQKVQEIFTKMMAEGDTQKAIGYANELLRIRVEHTLWLTDDINEQLETIEKMLREIGGHQRLYDARGDLPGRDLLWESFTKFSQVMHLPNAMGIRNEQDRETTKERSLIGIIEYLRESLRVNQLTELRNQIIDKHYDRPKG